MIIMLIKMESFVHQLRYLSRELGRPIFQRTKPKGSNCLLYKRAVTAFWLADLLVTPFVSFSTGDEGEN